MIRLENISRKGNLISAHVCILEDDFATFDITVDIDSEDIVSCTREKMDWYISHARHRLVEIGLTSTEKTTPRTATVAWY